MATQDRIIKDLVRLILFIVRSMKGPRRDQPQLFYIYKNGQQYGPYARDDISGWLRSGKLQPSDLVWHQNTWVPLSSLPVIVQAAHRTGING